MLQTKEIIVPRGQNIGKSIINNLTESNLYNKVKIMSFNFLRKPKERKTLVTIKYKYNLK